MNVCMAIDSRCDRSTARTNLLIRSTLIPSEQDIPNATHTRPTPRTHAAGFAPPVACSISMMLHARAGLLAPRLALAARLAPPPLLAPLRLALPCASRALCARAASEQRALGERRVDHLSEALEMVRACAVARFDETVELAVVLNVDTKRSDERVRGRVLLPHGTGKLQRVAVFARGELADAAVRAGADPVGAEDLIAEVAQGKINFDRCLATPDVLPALAKVT